MVRWSVLITEIICEDNSIRETTRWFSSITNTIRLPLPHLVKITSVSIRVSKCKYLSDPKFIHLLKFPMRIPVPYIYHPPKKSLQYQKRKD